MQAEKHRENEAHIQRARELLAGFDLLNAADLRRARELLQREDIPQWVIFELADQAPNTEAGMRWAQRRLKEMRDSGELS